MVDRATNKEIVSFICGIADEVLRELFKWGKNPDVILPISVIRRTDALLEPINEDVAHIAAIYSAGQVEP